MRSRIGDHNMERLDAALSKFKLYAPFKKAIADRAIASQSEKSTPAEDFAKEVVSALLPYWRQPPAVIFAGHLTGIFRLLAWLAPRALVDRIFSKRFGLAGVRVS